jgi:hypothetical protein
MSWVRRLVNSVDTYDVGDRDLGKGFDGCDEEALDDAFGNPFSITRHIGTAQTSSVLSKRSTSQKYSPPDTGALVPMLVIAHRHVLGSQLTIAPRIEMRYVNRLPYRSEKGCQNNSPMPRSKYIYPVPSFSVAIETFDCCARGTRTEYTVATDIPVNQVYLT